MPSIPLPFIVTGFLLFVLVRMLQDRVRQIWFLLFVAACAVQSALVGLRWSADLDWVRIVQPFFAACLPLLAWGAFETLRHGKVSVLHGLWIPAVIASWRLFPAAVDVLLVLEFLFYGLRILFLRFPDGTLARVRIGDEWTIPHAQRGVAALLVLSALVDTLVSLALTSGDGAFAAPAIAAMMSVMLVGIAGSILARTGRVVPEEGAEPVLQEPPEPAFDPAAEKVILAAVEAELDRGLYKDYDLTLQRLARRTRIPARKISEAVNRMRGCSVTDLVNGYRIEEAKRLLRETDLAITQIMLEAGFQTKSNFNRAFRAFAGLSPSEYRRSGSG